MLLLTGLIILAVATASAPLLLLAAARFGMSRHLIVGRVDGTKPVILGLLILMLMFAAKVFLVTGLESTTKSVQPFIKASEKTLMAVSSLKPQPFKEGVMPIYLRPYRWQALPSVAPYPPDNPPTSAKIALGQKLFNDKNLSADKSIACATCHDLQRMAGADSRKLARGIGGKQGPRNTPTVWNSAFQTSLFWDGRANSLEQQALQPILNPIEMGMISKQAVIDRLTLSSEYRKAFYQVFGQRTITTDMVSKALASYQRTLLTNDSPYDDFVRGERQALTEQQLSGMALFERTGCVLCHNGPNFSAASVFSNNQPLRLFPANPSLLAERYALTGLDGKPAVWRVPSLRNVALTGPWLHNGSIDSLEEVVRIMATAQLGKNTDRTFLWSDNQLTVVENPLLTDSEVKDIVAFLNALTSKRLAASSESTYGN